MSTFSTDQIEQIRQWASETTQLSELQTRINDTFKSHLTYMDLRFLLDDHSITLKTEEAAPEAEKTEPQGEWVDEGPTGSVSVSVDPVTQPGFLINGQVTFSDGQKASWHLDELGRIGLKPNKMGYRPTQEDLMQFQQSVQQQIARLSQGSMGL